jgi:hypothetical protein
MGINTNNDRRKFTFTSELSYDSIVSSFRDANIATVLYLSASEEILVTYADCVALKVLSKNIETGEYTAEVSINAVERQIKELRQQVDALTAGSN